MEVISHNDDGVIIAFLNSSNELEYTVYKPIDGGVVQLDESIDLIDALEPIAQSFGIDSEIQLLS